MSTEEAKTQFLMSVDFEVIDDKESDTDCSYKYHVNIANIEPYPDEEWEDYWGENLAEIAWVVAIERDIDELSVETFDKICAAFLRTSLRKSSKQRAIVMIAEAQGAAP
jgi:hypothetical protein